MKDCKTEDCLVKRAKEGDYNAFSELVEKHESKVYSIAMNILRNREEAEDAVQNIFIKALENLNSFRGDAAFSTWLNRITTNTSLNMLRKRKGLFEDSLDDEDDGAFPFPEMIALWSDNPLENLEKAELKNILDSSISSLADKYRVIFLLRDVEGLSIEETANILDISKSNVKVRLLRARLALREKLTAIFGDKSQQVDSHHHDNGQSEKEQSYEM